MRLIDKRRQFTSDLSLLLAYANAIGFFVILDQTLRSQRESEWNANHCRVQLHGGGKTVRCEQNKAAHQRSLSLPGSMGIRHSFKPIGIANSTHRSGLAADIYIMERSAISNDREKYARLGAFWKDLRPENCWGGDFDGFPDLGHFSREHEGRK